MVVLRSCLRVRSALTALLLTSLLIWCVLHWHADSSPSIARTHPSSSVLASPDLFDAQQKFWKIFNGYLEKYAPATTPIMEYVKAPTERFIPDDARPRPDYLTVDAEDIAAIKAAHTGFVTAITSKTSAPDLPYIPGTKGIVSTAGGTYLPVLVISLRMLRRTGSTLPMEVFLADEEEYEEYICEVVLPSLAARCIVISRVLAAAPAAIEKYQLKPFAMIFSSFEEILFLDADAFPLDTPETLFHADPFLSTGLVTWPDFWGSTVSPIFYDIIGVPAPPLGLRQSTESGEVLVSKKTHSRTLLLATYYNYWGPSHYYPLLSQGAAGEGDKESFLAAATAMRETFYQVSEPIVALGHHRDKNGGFAGSAMAQSHPVQDYALVRSGIARVRGDKAPPPDVFFVHANFPKFNPATVFDQHEVTPTFTDEGAYTRAWTIPEEVVGKFSANHDVEKMFWAEVKWTACELEDKFLTWKGYRGICDQVSDYWQEIFERKPQPT